MATHDYVIANASGAAVRADLNNALAAIVTNNSNATEPATTYPYMLWADTTAGQLKLRNGTNDAWIVLQELDGTLLMDDGTVAAPGLAFASDVDTGFYRPAADQLAVATNGVERVKYGTTEVVFNDGAEDYDFRVEGSTQPSLIATNAGDNTISFGGNITSDTVYDGDVQMASLNGGQLAGFKNQLINADHRIWQRGTNVTDSVSSASSKYLSVDRWAFFTSGNGQNIRVARNGNPISEAPVAYSMQLDSATIALDEARLIQGIELTRVGFADQFKVGTTWTLSVYSDTDLTSRTPGYGFADDTIRTNNVGGGSIESWQSLGGNRYKSTFTINVAPVGTSIIFYILDAPPTGSTAVNYTCWQLEPGPVATPFEHRPIGTELALCQRYYEEGTYETRFGLANGSIVASWTQWVSFATTKRATPTMTGTNAQGTFLATNPDVYGCSLGRSNTVANRINSGTYEADAEL